jgi:hypothetical protein
MFGSYKFLTPVFILLIGAFLIFWNIESKKLSCKDCKRKLAEEVHGKVSKILTDQNDGKFIMIFVNGETYNGPDFRYDIEVGDSIYKVPGEFTYYIYKKCRKDYSPNIIRLPSNCDDCKGFLW